MSRFANERLICSSTNLLICPPLASGQRPPQHAEHPLIPQRDLALPSDHNERRSANGGSALLRI